MRRLTGRCPRCDCRYPLHIHAGPTPEPKTLIFLASAPDKNRFIASRTGETGVLWCRFSRPRRKFRLKRGFPMKKLLFLLLLVPVLGWAQSPFDGTWKVDLNKAKLPKKPDVFLLQNGMYECKTCAPPINVKADGQFQKVSGYPYFDMEKVTVIDDRHVNTEEQKDGKPISSGKWSVSEDGNTLSIEWTYNGNPSGGPVSGVATSTRVAKGAAGSNAISGSWRQAKLDVATAEALIFTYKTDG